MTTNRRRGLRRALPVVVLAAGVLALAALAGAPRRDAPPLAPTGTGAAGTKALVDVLDELGVAVRIGDRIDGNATHALLLVDHLPDAEAKRLRRWVRSGGTLVVTDPRSRFTPDVAGSAGIGPLHTSLPRDCDLPALAEVARVSAGSGVVYDNPGRPAVACFPRGQGHWLVASPQAAGSVVALGGPEALTNAALGKGDNGVLAAALLAADEEASVVIVPPGVPGQGEATLPDLVDDAVWYALVQLLIAFAVVVAWRSRRLGKPVSEPQPVQLAGSELVTAVGNLLQQTRARGQTARLLRADVRRDLLERLGLPADCPPERLVDALVGRTGRTPAQLAPLVSGSEPADEAGVVELADELEAIRQAALRPAVPPAVHEEDARVR